MGCAGSKSASVSVQSVSPPPGVKGADKGKPNLYGSRTNSSISSSQSTPSNVSNISAASKISDEHHTAIHQRLRKLQELDATTKVPFILVELRGLGDGQGFIEICGKDEYGVYAALDEWLVATWGCMKLDAGDLSEDTMVPFCDALYQWNSFKTIGQEGTNNMGLATMQLVDFMAGKLGWTLGIVNGGNVGEHGEIREQQIIFKSPHPMNFVVPHMMIELRSAGYIEVCGSDGAGCGLAELEEFFTNQFRAKRVEGLEGFCDRYYKTGQDVFKERGKQGENNLGLLTTQLCDAVVRILPGWSLVTCNGGNYGEEGNHREQQLVFRWDNHPLQAAPHLLVELRDAGYVEVCGEDDGGIYGKLKEWLKNHWGAAPLPWLGQEPFANAKYKWKPQDMMVATGQLTSFFHSLGWQMQVCSQGTVKIPGFPDSREQQVIFRPGASGLGIVEPHLIIELNMGEGRDDLNEDPNATQVLANQQIRTYPIGDCSAATGAFNDFIMKYMGGCRNSKGYNCDVFLQRGKLDNNLGQWTMRVCDFMCDRLGWSFVVCNVCNLGAWGNLREQQLIFRYDGERREMPKADANNINLSMIPKETPLPGYWTIGSVIQRQQVQEITPCTQEEIQSLQDVFDSTFRRVLTRDRVYEYQATTSEEMPYRLEVVHAFRSEHAYLWNRYQQRRRKINANAQFDVKTRNDPKDHVTARLGKSEAYLFHGTNPSSSMSILKTGFALSNAGKSTGTMFGYGTYLAECSSKSDEYARDDGGNTYPGLCAMLICRSLIGKPMVVTDPGDHIAKAQSEGFDCIVGDRETKVGTYREFVFWDESQILPEYTVIYRRQYVADRVPKHMQRRTSGTTGRFWQVKFDKGWGSVAPDANRSLLEAMKKNQSTVDVKIGDTEYTFDLAKKQQINKTTGTTRQLRAPMVAP